MIEGWTEIGDENDIYPFASIGLPPQDLKYRGAPTRLAIGHRNVFREFVTIHRGTEHGGGLTTIGDRNLFMAYSHVAHDCHVGSDIIFGNGATLGGHVTVEDFATVSAFSGVHQFCRVGQHAFIGGYSVLTKDALPYAKTVGNRAKHLRAQHDRPAAPRVRARDGREAEEGLSPAADLEAEHDPGHRPDRRVRGHWRATRCATCCSSSPQSPRGVTLKRGTKRAEDGGDD